MDKIKSMMSGHKQESVAHEAGQSTNPINTGSDNTTSGQGSHFGSSRTAGNDPLSSSTDPTSTSGTHGLTEPHSSRMPGTFDDDAATTASVKSGIPGTFQSGIHHGLEGDTNKPLPNEPGSGQGMMGSNSTSAGPHASNLANTADPRVDSNLDGSRGLGGNSMGTGSGISGKETAAGPYSSNRAHPRVDSDLDGSRGIGSNTNTGMNSSSGYGNQSTGSSHLGRDTALGAGAVGAGTAASHHRHADNESDTGRSFPLGGNSTSTSGYSAPGQVGTYPAGGAAPGTSSHTGSSNITGPHSSGLANKADPRVDSDLDGARGGIGSDTGYGSSNVNSGMGSGITNPTAGSHSSDLANKANPRGGSDLDNSRGIGNTATQSTASGVGSNMGYGSESWKHDHDTHGHTYTGDPCGPGETAAAGPHFTSGPHSTDTANRLDPHVTGSSGTTGGISSAMGSNAGSTNTGIGSSDTHHGRDAALAGGAIGAAGVGASQDHHRTPTTDTSTTGASTAGTSADGPAPNTAGPHKSDMLNKLDPRVDSDLSKQRDKTGLDPTSTGSGLGSSKTGTSDPYSSSTRGHHEGRDAGLTGAGAGLGGAAAYEGTKHYGAHDPVPNTSTTGSSAYPSSKSGITGNTGSSSTTTAGPHRSNLESKVDPHADSDLYGQRDLGSSREGGSGYDSHAGTGHHYGRDAGLVGAGGVGAYEAEKHLGSHGTTSQDRLAGSSHQPTVASSSTPQDRLAGSGNQTNLATGTSDPYSSTSRDHHTGRDATLGAGSGAGIGGLAAHDHKDGYGDKALGSNYQPIAGAGTSQNYPTNREHHTGNDHDAGRDNHTGRNAALGAGAGAGVGGLAAHQYEKQQGSNITDLSHQSNTPAGTTATPTTSRLGPASGSGLESSSTGTSDPHSMKGREHHTGRDTALGAGVGAGAAGLAAHEYNDKDAKRLDKEQHQEAKYAEKEARKHDKAVAKEEKKHDNHHDSGEKKPGLMDRLLHRHHDDKAATTTEEAPFNDPATGKGLYPNRTGDQEMGAGAGTTGLENRMANTGMQDSRHSGGHVVGNEHEHGSSSGVHATPIGSGMTTHDAYNTSEGQNKLHKDPPAKVMEQRGL